MNVEGGAGGAAGSPASGKPSSMPKGRTTPVRAICRLVSPCSVMPLRRSHIACQNDASRQGDCTVSTRLMRSTVALVSPGLANSRRISRSISAWILMRTSCSGSSRISEARWRSRRSSNFFSATAASAAAWRHSPSNSSNILLHDADGEPMAHGRASRLFEGSFPVAGLEQVALHAVHAGGADRVPRSARCPPGSAETPGRWLRKRCRTATG